MSNLTDQLSIMNRGQHNNTVTLKEAPTTLKKNAGSVCKEKSEGTPVYVIEISDEAKELSLEMLKSTAQSATTEQIDRGFSGWETAAIKDPIKTMTKGGNQIAFRSVNDKAGRSLLLADVITNAGDAFAVLLDRDTLISEDADGKLSLMHFQKGTDGDDIIVNFGGGAPVSSGKGDDFVLQIGSKDEQSDFGYCMNSTVFTGAGNDTVHIIGQFEGITTVKTGSGDDSVNVVGSNKGNISTGTGNDDVRITSGQGNDSVGGYSGRIATGSGNDSVVIDRTKQAYIFTGDGDDFVEIDQMGIDDGKVYMRGTMNRLDTGTGDDSILLKGAVNFEINTGDGDNNLTVIGDIKHGVIKTGEGETNIAIKGDAEGVLFDLASKKSTLTISGTVKELFVHLASAGAQKLFFNAKLLEEVKSIPFERMD